MSESPTSWWQIARSLLRQGHTLLRETVPSNALDHFPIRRQLRGYKFADLRADLRAGASVALLDLPQGIAYAAVAGLPLQFGPTCSATAGVIGSLFGSSRYTVLGPTNAMAFMIFSFFAADPDLNRLTLMPLLVFIVGGLLLVGSYLRVAELSQYISRAVIIAYVTGAALLIISNQVAHVLGVQLTIQLPDGSTLYPRTFPGMLIQLTKVIGRTHWPSLLIAAITAAIYWGIRRWNPRWPGLAIALVGGSLVGVALQAQHIDVLTYRDAKFGVLDLLPTIPDFTSPKLLSDFSRLFGLAVALAFLSTLESSTMAKTLAGLSRQRVDVNQDMFNLGMANLGCAYLSGMPCSGSLTRSAFNYHSGARSALSGLVNGILCLAGALMLGNFVTYVPKAALAVLIICVAISLIHQRNIRICLQSTGSDALTFLITLAATLLVPLHVAIFTGVGVSLMLYLRKASRPSLVEYEFNQEGNLAESQPGRRAHPAISIVHVEGELFFGAAELFRNQVQVTCSDPNLRIIILRLKNARHMDATSVLALDDLVHILRADKRDIIISGVTKDVYRVLRDSGMVEVIGKDNIFPGSPANPNIATRNALKRAQEILGTTEAEVRIYVDENKSKATKA